MTNQSDVTQAKGYVRTYFKTKIIQTMKTTQYNFQVRSLDNRKDWESIEPIYKNYHNRAIALLFTRKLSRDFKAEVRVTQGTEPLTTSGTYIREIG